MIASCHEEQQVLALTLQSWEEAMDRGERGGGKEEEEERERKRERERERERRSIERKGEREGRREGKECIGIILMVQEK